MTFQEGILGLILSSIFIIGGLIIITIEKGNTRFTRKDPDFPDVDSEIIFYLKKPTALLREPSETSEKVMDISKNSRVLLVRRDNPNNVWWCNIKTIDDTEGWLKAHNLAKAPQP